MKKIFLYQVFIMLNIGFLYSQNLLVAYYSQTGNTEAMAKAVAQGAESVSGVKVQLLTVADVQEADLLAADAVIVGSPVYNANVAPQVQTFINSWPFQDSPMRDKIGAAFATGGGISAGEEVVQLNILHSMLVFGMVVVGGPEWQTAFGASAITDEKPGKPGDKAVDEYYLKKAKALGKRVALLAVKMKN